MEKIKLAPPVNDLAAQLMALHQQTSVLALALGCHLKAIGHKDPEMAKSIEDNFRLLLNGHDLTTWQEGPQKMIDLLLTAMQERSSNG